MSIIDHVQQSNSRIPAQYRNKEKFVDWIAINGTAGNEIEQAYCDILSSYDIDAAEGAQLDVIGRIVGIGREFEKELQLSTNQFGRETSQFGADTAYFESPAYTGSQELSDEYYRLIIKSKISKNNGRATLDDISSALSFFVSDQSNIQIIDGEDMTFSVEFSETLGESERQILDTFDVIPRPQGVQFTGYVEI